MKCVSFLFIVVFFFLFLEWCFVLLSLGNWFQMNGVIENREGLSVDFVRFHNFLIIGLPFLSKLKI